VPKVHIPQSVDKKDWI